MNLFRLRYWILGGYLLPVLFSGISALVVASRVEVVKELAEELEQSRQVAEKIGEVGFNIQILPRAARGYLLEKTDESLNSYNIALQEIEKLFKDLADLIKNPEQKKSLGELQEYVKNLDEFDQRLISLVNQGKTSDAIKLWRETGAGRDLSREITDVLNKMRAKEKEIVEEEQKQQNQALDNLLLAVWLSTGLALLASISVGLWIVSTIVNRLNKESSGIASAANQIATTVEEQERLTAQQAAAVNQTTASVDELGASSRQSAEQAASASAGANQVFILANGKSLNQQGSAVNIAAGTVSLKDKIGQVQTQILRLSEHLSQIYNITNVVSDLASQTNMLALNASVEAARAGEHGKGFAVVATEIRKLADQSKQSADKINGLIMDIQNSANSTVVVTEDGTKAVDDIVNSISDVAVNIQQISLTTKQQAIAIQQVVDAMNSLNISARETASGITQTKLGTQQLNRTAMNLQELI
ncbi:MAG: methyl-accepting chemotaxis protein [Microcoleaceae cyanobacterium]